ncbi:MAG TPA: fibronectin type III domain-containing protein [Gemmatimonadales bacterium]|nr:fibronectin type III domain-containing protein [Gemmatimonadales bacterium]
MTAFALYACAQDEPTAAPTHANSDLIAEVAGQLGTVTDLATTGVTDSAVTLSFTEVDDGTGSPASYFMRFARPALSWGSATDVSQGTCSVPITGIAIGGNRTCQVRGLEPGMSYQFELVPFRGTLNVDAVFGALSNVVGATTASQPPPPPSNPGTVTDLAVSNVTDTVATLSFTEVNDGTGQPASYDIRWAPGTISWGSATDADRGSCKVPLSGSSIGARRNCTVSGLSAATSYQFQMVAFRGTLNKDAVFGGLSNAASGTTTGSAVEPPPAPPPAPPAPPPSGGWPNEPAGLTVRTDWALDQPIPQGYPLDEPIPGAPAGWNIVYEVQPGGRQGSAVLGSDAGAPLSPSSVYDFVYPQGMVEGNAPATIYYNMNAGEVFAGFWWKPSSPFDYGPNGNKIAFLFNGGGATGGQQFLILSPDGRLHVLPEYPGDFHWRDPNVNATVVTLGTWHRIEWYCQLSSGTLKWWLDGVLQGSYTDVRNAYNFNMFQFSPTWGGNSGATKRETDHYWYDHVHISSR